MRNQTRPPFHRSFRELRLRFFGLAALIVLLFGVNVACAPEPCTTANCKCEAASDCGSGLACQGGVCVAVGSEPPPPDASAPPERKPPELRPDIPPDTRICAPGSVGCRCLPTGNCQQGLRCINGTCEVCQAGSAGCACKADNTCSGGLKCEGGVCKGCTGKENCPCYGNNSCDVGLRCKLSTTSINTCLPCKGADKTGCNCKSDADCGKDVCINRRCIPLSKANQVPQNPRCYMPCQADIKLPSGSILTCHSTYKLADGCAAGQSCREGSCILDSVKELKSAGYPFCQIAADCPSWQTCVAGRCYSTCRSNAQCLSGFSCHAYVCRRKCNVRKNECQSYETCATQGVDDGVCTPKTTGYNPAPPQSKTPGTFDIPEFAFAFDNLQHTKELHIINRSEFAATFTIKRARDSINGSKKPLFWLKFDLCKTYTSDRSRCTTFAGRPSSSETITLKDLAPNKKYIIQISNAQGKPKANATYDGALTVSNPQLGSKDVFLNYRTTIGGQWRGTMVAFGNFNDEQIAQFPAKQGIDIQKINNALLQRWINFKFKPSEFEKFLAAIRSVREGTWSVPKVASDCKRLFSTSQSEDVVCFPFSSPKGYEVLSFSRRQAPVPSGVSELKLSINVKETSATQLSGRIDSEYALQYPGNPEVQITLTEALGAKALIPIKSFSATIDIGGQYNIPPDGACADTNTFAKVRIPWLIPGFAMGTTPTPGSLFRSRYKCQMFSAPRGIPPKATEAQKNAIRALNRSLSASNPVPNGRALRRKLEFIDGALIQGRYIFLLYRETFVSFFDGQQNNTLSKNFSNYGYVLLTRTPGELATSDYKGEKPIAQKSCQQTSECGQGKICQGGACLAKSQLQQVTCTSQVVQKSLGFGIPSTQSMRAWTSQQMDDLVSVLLTGQSVSNNSNAAVSIEGKDVSGSFEVSYMDGGQTHYVHYLCQDTGQFDGGPLNNPKPCPAGSKITYFSLPNVSTLKLRGEACQDKGECNKRFDDMKFGTRGIRLDVPYRCKDGSIFCDDASDLRKKKVFFRPAVPGRFVSPYTSLSNAMYQAFRYRLKFASRSGKNIGFTPTLCAPGTSTLKPYCYDAKVIEDIEARVNCLQYVYSQADLAKKLSPKLAGELKKWLEFAFSFTNRKVNGQIITDFGFETLNAELKIMLGDESFTRSFASRYDLANTSQIAFDGVAFEPNGVSLSGALGFEMHNLYLSTQYYQTVLDRFFSQASVLHQTMQSPQTTFITTNSVTSYFKKLLLASTRKARSWGQIAKRYHQLNRPDLAKHVLNRAYASTYMEMTILTRLLNVLIRVIKRESTPQVQQEIALVALTYKSALLDMEETFKQLQLSINTFGLPPNTIPFPALDRFPVLTGSINAFQYALQFAKEKMFIARNKEQAAIQDKRSFDTSAASFQNELVRIERNFENQLADICGRISVTDANGQARLYPAIPKYAHLSAKTRTLSNPCGLVPGGALFNALSEMEKVRINVLSLKKSQENIVQQIQLERDRIKTYCDAKFELAKITLGERTKQHNLQLEIEQTQRDIEKIIRVTQTRTQAAEMVKCSIIVGTSVGGDCLTAGVSIALIMGLGHVQEQSIASSENKLKQRRADLLRSERLLEQTQLQFECRPCNVSQPSCNKTGTARIESNIRLKELASQELNLHYEALKAELDVQIASSNVVRLHQQAQLLITQQNEATQLAVNVQAAQSDPNTRIYKNDAIISAERTFRDAIREAYRTTLLYEYYTGTTYAKKGELYLIRMIAYGDKNLEAYLSQLEQAFRDFEEDAGKPDVRILVLSLRDDILKIPRTLETPGGLVSQTLTQRIAAFQKKLTDRANLNEEGFTAFPFQISVSKKDGVVSPVTYNHKVLYIESEIVGGEIGDDQGRLYLRQSGTGVVRLKGNEIKYHTLPPRTAVLNPFFNGTKVFTPEVYRNFRLLDRPLGNTQWVLLLNQLSEKANQDINLNTIDDIRLYIYYSDFTEER